METNSQVKNTKVAHPLLGVFGVLLGASIATFLGRLLSVGTTDLRGALAIDFDSASWMGTTYNMGMMFIGPFSVYLGGILGPRVASCLVQPASSLSSALFCLSRGISESSLDYWLWLD